MVTLNLPHDNLTSLVQLFYSVGLLCTYPMQIIPAIEISEKTDAFNKLPTSPKFPVLKSLIFRSLVVVLTAVSAMVVPKFGLFVNLTGAFACTGLAFVLPPIMYNKAYSESISQNRKRFNYAVIGFGMFCGLISFVMSLIEIVRAFTIPGTTGGEF